MSLYRAHGTHKRTYRPIPGTVSRNIIRAHWKLGQGTAGSIAVTNGNKLSREHISIFFCVDLVNRP